MQPRLSIVTLGVSDLPKSRAFYERGLGFPASVASNEHVVFFKTGGIVLALFPREELAKDAGVPAAGDGFRGIALAHNVAEKQDVAKALKLAELAGGTVVKPAQDVFWGGHSGYFADPDGFLWEVAWNPHFPLDERGGVILP